MSKKYNTPHRTHPIKSMLTEEEYSEFANRCNIYQMSQAEVIRQAISGATIKPVIKVSATSDELLDVLGKILAELGKNGGNLNQIAKVLNEFHAPYDALEDDVRTAIANISELKYELLEKVGDAIGNDQTYKL